MGEVSFSVSARAARLIGQENFANADGAVIELVKNSYDADAPNSLVFFDNLDENVLNHSLYIIDNGIGMTDGIIRDFWMMIGTDNKENEYESFGGRVKTGAKGIGRFALDRLGEVAEMFTLPKEASDGFFWKVNWEDFKKAGIGISDVKATLDGLPQFNYKEKIAGIGKSCPKLLDYIKDLEFKNGTLIKISGLRDNWPEEDITRLFNNLEILIPPKEQPDFKIAMYATNLPESFGELAGAYYDDFDYKVVAEYSADDKKTVNITIQRNELDLHRIEKHFSKVFEMPLMKGEFYSLDSFKKGEIEFPITLSELIKGYSEANSEELLEKIGKFTFTFYYLKLSSSDTKKESDTNKYPYRNFNSASRRAWLKKFGGVKIFRDQFRVRPYGEYGQDWLSLGDRQATSPQGAGQRIGAYRIGPNQISGTINISRLTNLSFQDKSGREGIQENDVFDLFKVIITNIINQFEKDRNIIMFSFSELYKIQKAEEAAKAEAEELAKKILEQEQQQNETAKPKDNSTTAETVTPEITRPSETEIVLAKGFQAKEEEVLQKEEEIRLLRSLSGTGLIVASVAHELRSLRSLLINRTDDLKKIMEKLISKSSLKALKDFENPFSMLNHMREQDVQIKHWLDYALSALQRDRRTRTSINLSSYFEAYISNWESVCNRRQVKLVVKNELDHSLSIKAFAIDLDTVFNNLLVNSFDSFKRRKDHSKREVNIFIKEKASNLEITFSDNGAGLSKDYSKNPEEIFQPFETSKVDRKGNKIGTGMGMYLVKSIVDDYRGVIDILPVTEGFALQISFPLRKTI